MNCSDIQPRLSGLVDGELDASAKAEVDRHLAGCVACAGLAHDLRAVRHAAAGLGPVAPPAHLAMEIAGRLQIEHTADPGAADAEAAPETRAVPLELARRPRPARAAWQWVGLAAALLLVTSVVYLLSRQPPAPAPEATTASAPASGAGNAAPSGSVEAIADELQQAATHYENALNQIEALAKNSNAPVSPQVTASLQRDLGVIDQAITESRAALKQDPQSDSARDSLLDALRRKVTVLQETVALMNDMRKGDESGAARIVGGRSSSGATLDHDVP